MVQLIMERLDPLMYYGMKGPALWSGNGTSRQRGRKRGLTFSIIKVDIRVELCVVLVQLVWCHSCDQRREGRCLDNGKMEAEQTSTQHWGLSSPNGRRELQHLYRKQGCPPQRYKGNERRLLLWNVGFGHSFNIFFFLFLFLTYIEMIQVPRASVVTDLVHLGESACSYHRAHLLDLHPFTAQPPWTTIQRPLQPQSQP